MPFFSQVESTVTRPLVEARAKVASYLLECRSCALFLRQIKTNDRKVQRPCYVALARAHISRWTAVSASTPSLSSFRCEGELRYPERRNVNSRCARSLRVRGRTKVEYHHFDLKSPCRHLSPMRSDLREHQSDIGGVNIAWGMIIPGQLPARAPWSDHGHL